jgi:polygalacturonase
MQKLFLKIFLLTVLSQGALCAKDYNASLFGIKSDGITLNTQSIQKAIDFISEKGGGKLKFYVGRYLTGSVQLKSNVSIELNEGAVLVGTTSIYDYMGVNNLKALMMANKTLVSLEKGSLRVRGLALSNKSPSKFKRDI